MQTDEAWRRLHAAAEMAARRGSLIFHLDLACEAARPAFAAAGVGTDVLATLVDDAGYRVFAFEGAPLPRVVAEARFDRAGQAVVEIAPQSVPPRAETLARARQTILRGTVGRDTAAHAVVVIPGTDPLALLQAYSIPTGRPEAMILGGHTSFVLTADGRAVTATVPLTLSIGRAEAPPIRLETSSAVPNEMHTYLSLKHGLPIRLHTRESGANWLIDGERTTLA